MKAKKHGELVDILSDEHLRQRIDPRPGDFLYLHLSDLLLAIKEHATNEPLDILDFGAGISPYQSLFPNARYKRADFSIGENQSLDFILDESLIVSCPDNSFDRVISTQVLEHVIDPKAYLLECLRLLRPGGQLILSTHGIYADHPCPFDLHRWTASGLSALCTSAGFTNVSVKKLTVDARALLFLYDLYGRKLHRRAFSVFSAVLAINYRVYNLLRKSIHQWADKFYPNSRVTGEDGTPDEIYINILTCATKGVTTIDSP